MCGWFRLQAAACSCTTSFRLKAGLANILAFVRKETDQRQMNASTNPFSTRSAASATNLIDLLRRRAATEPDQIAYTFLVDGEAQEQTLTYAAIDLKARAIGAALQSLGLSGEPVLIVYPPGLEYIVAFFGCIYSGAIAVPVYPRLRSKAQSNLANVARDCGAAAALTSSSLMKKTQVLVSEAPGMRDLKWISTEEIEAGLEAGWQEPDAEQDDPAFLQYTSGSTSDPKGVIVSHGNILHNQEMIRQAFRQSSESVIVSWLPLYHDMGLIGNVLQPLYTGAKCILMPPLAFLQKPLRWLQAISRYGATTSGGPNFAYDLCVSKISPDRRAELDLSAWRVAFNGAEPVRAATLERFVEAFEPYGFRRDAFQPCYGLAEATLLASTHRRSSAPVVIAVDSKAIESGRVIQSTAPDARSRTFVCCGQPSSGQELVIVDPKERTRCGPNQVGEIWISGPSVAGGYYRRKRETEETFKATLADGGDSHYLRTGDLGFIANDGLFITGRLKDVMIIRGSNHYPQDIELTVEKSHRLLKPASGAAFLAHIAGEERAVVVQALDHRERSDRDVGRIITIIKETVGREHEIELGAVVLVTPASIPKTSSGKIRRSVCRDRYLSRNLDIIGEWSVAGDSAPAVIEPIGNQASASRIEDVLKSALAAKLQISPSMIDIDRSICDYGVDSMTSLALSHEVEVSFGISLPMTSFLDDSTIRDLASQAVRVADAPAAPSACEESVVGGAHPVSQGQRALWFLNQLAPDKVAHNLAFAAYVRSELDIDALRRSMQRLVDRHSVLRTRFGAAGAERVQIIDPAAAVCFKHEVDSGTDSEFGSRLAREAHSPFDLEKGPLFRASLFSRPGRDRVLLLAIHHIIADLWSVALLLREVALFYREEVGGARAMLEPVRREFWHYARRQAEMESGSAWETHWEYWRRELGAELPLLSLPSDKARLPVQTYRGAAEPFELDRTLTDQLSNICRLNGATLYMGLLAAFQVLLYRYSGQEDILVGTPTTGRPSAEWADTPGYFVNPVVIRARISSEQTFAERLSKTKRKALDAFRHQELPFSILVERLQPERDLSVSPIFQAAFALHQAHVLDPEGLSVFALGLTGARLNLGGIELESIALEEQFAQFDLTLLMAEGSGGLMGVFQHNRDLFGSNMMKRLAAHFVNLVAEVTSHPERRLSEFSLLDENERAELVGDVNSTEARYSLTHPVHKLVEIQAARIPDAAAVTINQSVLTYNELNSRANQLARRLFQSGSGPETIVPVLGNRSLDSVVGMLGVLKTGGAYLPLDPSTPPERLILMLNEVMAPVLLTWGEDADHCPAPPGTEVLRLDSQWGQISELDNHDPVVALMPDNLAYVIFTSGSTGIPKGVQISHASLLNLVYWHQRVYGVTSNDRATHVAGPGFDASVWEIWPYLTSGAMLHLPDDETRKSSAALRDWLMTVEATITFMPTPLAEWLIAAEWPDQISLRAMLTGGDLLRRRPTPELRFELINHYGPTECSVVTTSGHVSAGIDTPGPPPIGRPIDNTHVYVLDAGMQSVPKSVVGELFIGGAGVARGYFGSPDLTAERFLPDAHSGERGSRVYRSGDLVRFLEDGQLEYLARTDRQVKIRGFRIEPGEIEAALTGQDSVRDAAVILCCKGSEEVLVAFVVLKDDSGISSTEIRLRLKERLPEYMTPSRVIPLKEMPLTDNGKTDRRRLAELVREEPEDISGWEQPSTGVEEIIAGIWMEVLGRKRIGRQDDFFELGGHSLAASRVVSRVRELFNVEIPLRAAFEATKLTRFSELVRASLDEGATDRETPLQRAPRNESLPLSFAQQRLWFLNQLEPTSPFYNISIAIRLTGALESSAIEASLNEIIKKHEVLRTNFVAGGRPEQVVHESRTLYFPVIDLSDLSEIDQEAAIALLAREEGRRSFDLAEDSLLRAGILRINPFDHVLLLTMHHIVSDGWSLGVFVRELAAAYRAFSENRPSPLRDLHIQYADYAKWQRDALVGAAFDLHLSYWKQQLSGAPPALDLITDHPRPAVQSFAGATVSHELEKCLADSLKTIGQREGCTLFMLMLTAVSSLLSRFTGEEEIIVGSPVAGRDRAELDGLIGFFANTVVLRMNLSGKPTFREALQRVRQVALDAYAHQSLPFDRVVEELQPARDMSRSPLFQVMLAMQDLIPDELDLPGVKMRLIEIDTETAKFDLTFLICGTPPGLKVSLEYCTALFDRTTAERLLDRLQSLLRSVAVNPDQTISGLPLLSEQELRQVIETWNDTTTDYPADRTIAELFQLQVDSSPSAVAVVCDGDELTYEELNTRANKLAHYLAKIGVGPEIRAGLCMERGIGMIVGLIAILKAGGAYVPLDPSYPVDRLMYMAADAGVRVVLTDDSSAGGRWKAAETILDLSRDWVSIARESEVNPAGKGLPENLAYVVYTSGSTGTPKGVAVTHRNVARLIKGADYARLDRGQVVLQFASSSFDAATFEIWGSLLNGARLVVSPGRITELHELGAAVSANQVTTMWLTAGLFDQMVDAELKALTGVRQLLAGGDALSVEHVRRAIAELDNCEIINGYGPTESTTFACCHRVSRDEPAGKSIPIGGPIANTQAYILDRVLQPVAVRAAGEIFIGGDGLARGYLNRPDLTAEKFLPDPFSKSEARRLYRTGDKAAYMSDGRIEFIGRNDGQVKIRGYRVEIGEIEAALERLDEIQQAAVIVKLVGSDKRLAAFVLPSDGKSPAAAEIRRRLRQMIPEYEIPTEIILLDEMPLTGNGKIDRQRLKEIEREEEAGPDFEEVRGGTEATVAGIWEEILGRSRIGRNDDFFSAGGHSLLAAQVVSRLRETFRVELSLRDFFEQPTIAGTAAVIEEAVRQRASVTEFSEPVRIHRDRYRVKLSPGGVIKLPEALRKALR